MAMDKDKAIITQVAAKIAADLVDKTSGPSEKLGEFAMLFPSINDILMDTIYQMTVSEAQTQNNNVVKMLSDEFGATEVSAPFTGVTIVGKQHGEIPEWLIKACKRDGISKVYDNRDGLTANPKRPHFKAVEGEKAYWPPRSRA